MTTRTSRSRRCRSTSSPSAASATAGEAATGAVVDAVAPTPRPSIASASAAGAAARRPASASRRRDARVPTGARAATATGIAAIRIAAIDRGDRQPFRQPQRARAAAVRRRAVERGAAGDRGDAPGAARLAAGSRTAGSPGARAGRRAGRSRLGVRPTSVSSGSTRRTSTRGRRSSADAAPAAAESGADEARGDRRGQARSPSDTAKRRHRRGHGRGGGDDRRDSAPTAAKRTTTRKATTTRSRTKAPASASGDTRPVSQRGAVGRHRGGGTEATDHAPEGGARRLTAARTQDSPTAVTGHGARQREVRAGFRTRGQPAGRARRRAMLAGGMPHALLLVGPPGVGKATLADDVAAGLLCLAPDPADRPCRACRACRAFEHGNHPDVHRLAPTGAGNVIPIGGREERGVRDLVRDLALLPVEGGARVAIVTAADRMTEDAQAAFLKTLEEPPIGTILILTAADEERLLPTIRSRCVRIRLGPVARRDVEGLLVDAELADAPLAARLARISAGRPGRRGRARPIADVARHPIRGRPDAPRPRCRRPARTGSGSVATCSRAPPSSSPRSAPQRRREPRAPPGRGERRRRRVAGRRRRCQTPAPVDGAPAATDAAGPAARVPAAERRAAAIALAAIWRDVARDLALVSLGESGEVRQIDLLDDLEAVAPRLPAGFPAGTAPPPRRRRRATRGQRQPRARRRRARARLGRLTRRDRRRDGRRGAPRGRRARPRPGRRVPGVRAPWRPQARAPGLGRERARGPPALRRRGSARCAGVAPRGAQRGAAERLGRSRRGHPGGRRPASSTRSTCGPAGTAATERLQTPWVERPPSVVPAGDDSRCRSG